MDTIPEPESEGVAESLSPPPRKQRKAIALVAGIGGLACLLGIMGLGFLTAAYATSGPSPQQLEATAYAKLTATAARWTATPTPTPTNTPTPTPTNTRTPTHTPTITPSPTPTPNLTEVKLWLSDLPAGFEAIDPDELGMKPSDEFHPENAVAFVSSDPVQYVSAFLDRGQTRLDQSGMDFLITHREMIVEPLVQGLKDENPDARLVSEMDLPGGFEVGDRSRGVRVVIDIGSIDIRVDVLVFRRQRVMGYVEHIQADQDEPLVSVLDLARRLDARLGRALGQSGQ